MKSLFITNKLLIYRYRQTAPHQQTQSAWPILGSCLLTSPSVVCVRVPEDKTWSLPDALCSWLHCWHKQPLHTLQQRKTQEPCHSSCRSINFSCHLLHLPSPKPISCTQTHKVRAERGCSSRHQRVPPSLKTPSFCLQLTSQLFPPSVLASHSLFNCRDALRQKK